MTLQADQEDPSKGFADNAEEGDAYVVVAFTSLAFFLIEGNDLEDGNDLGVRHVLPYSSFLPALAKDFI